MKLADGSLLRNLLRVLAGGRLAGLVLLMALLALRRWDPDPVETLRLLFFDQFQQLEPRQETAFPVVIVDIDEKSIAALGQWPWPRTILGQIVDRVTADGATAIAFDVVFSEPDRTAPIELKALLSLPPQDLANALANLPSNDALFAKSIARSRVVLSMAGLGAGDAAPPPVPEHIPVVTAAFLGGDPRPNLRPPFVSLLQNIEILSSAANGHGNISLLPEVDGKVRNIPMGIRVGDTVIPALSIDLLRVAAGKKSYAIKSDAAGIAAVVVGGVAIPTDRNGRIAVRFGPKRSERYVSAIDVIKGEYQPGRFANRLVLVGTSAEGLHDIKLTPVGRMPGVEIQAQLLETILSGTNLTRPNYALGMEVATTLLMGLLLIALVPLIGPRWTAFLLVAGTITLIAGSWFAFSGWRFLFDATYPVFSSVLIYLLLVYVKYSITDRGRRQAIQAFSQYLSPLQVQRLVDNPRLLRLGGEQRNITVMFSDIRNFTTISERFRDDPQGLTALINRFLTPMTDIVMTRHGTIDKYIGDSIMAFWNAPLDVAGHASEACASALEMAAALRGLNDELRVGYAGEGEAGTGGTIVSGPADPSLAMGIGINTGESVVGNLGSKQRFNYSALGDAVNLASRLESLTKFYGVPILISETTHRLAPAFAAIEVDLIAVKGKTEAVRTYGLLGPPEATQDDQFQQFATTHADMLRAYRSREWTIARQMAETCRALRPELARLYGLYLERIEAFRRDPPSADWDGVYVAETK